MATNPAHASVLLSNQLSASLQKVMQKRRLYVDSIAQNAVRDGTVQGFVGVDIGESVATVTFPVVFTQRPVFTSGLELPGNEWLTYGSFPLWSATIAAWNTVTLGDELGYRGATIGVVLFADTTENADLHYSFAGRSFTNPVGTDDSVGAVL